MIRQSKLTNFLIAVTLMISLIPTGGERAAYAAEPPVPLPRNCAGITPPGDPIPACCIYGYVYYNDDPVAGASVTIESPHGFLDASTVSGVASTEPYYRADLSDAPLSVSSGDVITITASYNGMVSLRTWTAQEGGQQVDVGLVTGYQATEPVPIPTGSTDLALSGDRTPGLTGQANVAEFAASEGVRVPTDGDSSQPPPENLSPDAWVRISAQLEQERYRFDPGGDGRTYASNYRQGLRFVFDADGVTVRQRQTSEVSETLEVSGGYVRLRLARYGAGEALREVGAAEITAGRYRLEYRYPAAGLTEWYENGPDGLKQGFTLNSPPHGAGALTLELALESDLAPRLTQDGSAVEWMDAGSATSYRYDGLAVSDAAGRALPARLELAAPNALHIVVDDTGAAYPITIDPLITSQVAKLTASDGEAGDWFGNSVAVSGDVVVVGAHYDDVGANAYQGSAYVYERNQGGVDNWGQVTKLTASDGAADDKFGFSVAVSGDILVVGAPADDVGGTESQGSAYVYERSQGGADNWGQVKHLTASDGAANDLFGFSVAVSGDIVVVGAVWDTVGANGAQGSAYVYERNQGGADNWGQVKQLTASDGAAVDYFGSSVAVDGDIVVVGADYDDVGANSNQGSAYVFARDQGGADNWGQVKQLTASDGAAVDYFGFSVAVSGDVVVVGAFNHDVGANESQGSAYVYERDQGGANNWGQVKQLTASDGAAGDFFGSWVAVSGDILVVGAYSDDVGANNGQGSAYVYERNQGGADNWGQVSQLTASDGATDDCFGVSVAVSGDIVVVGAFYGDVGANAHQGSAYVFVQRDTAWVQAAHPVASDGAAGDYFGLSVAVSGDIVVVGARNDDVGANGDQGSAYVYERDQGGADNWGQVKQLIASDGAVQDFFGGSVAVDGDTIVVGAYADDGANENQGSAYVYERDQGGADNWGQVKQLTASDGATTDVFGISVAVSGDVVVVGAYVDDVGANENQGSAYVYERNQGGADNWGQVKQLTASDGAAGDQLGFAVAASGDIVVVGAWGHDVGANDWQGSAYVFARNQGGADNWGQVKQLTASDGAAGDEFGHSVAVNGDVIVVGAYMDDVGANANQGSAYVYERNQGGANSWGQAKQLTASDGAAGDWFGSSVAVSGDILVVGACYDDVSANESQGSVYMYERSQGGADNWGQVSQLTASDGAAGDVFGYPAAASGDIIVVGAYLDDVSANADQGSAYIYQLAQGADLSGVAIGGPTTGVVSITYTFTATVSPITATLPITYVWQSAGQSPVTHTGGLSDTATFTWSVTGTQTITVTASNAGGAVADTHVISITGYAAPNAAFTGSPLSGSAPLNVAFTDQSTGAVTAWTWDLGDGGVSGARHPSYIYENVGTYTVSLTVAGPGGSDTETKTGYITVTATPGVPIASINYIWPNPAAQGQDTIYFNGNGYDTDEGGAYIVANVWTSSIDGQLSTQEDFTAQASELSAGAHTITFKVQDDEGFWSLEVTRTLTVQAGQADVRTLILVNRQKLATLYGDPEATQVMNKLNALAAHTAVKGLVVQVESDLAVADAYTAWDAAPTSTSKANAVTAAIRNVVLVQWAAHPDLEYLVIAGDDRAIPFRRVLDRTRYPERNYTYISCSSVTGAALCADMTLTDDYYADKVPTVPGVSCWDGHDLYIPDLGTGRLIETPAEIIAQIDTFLTGNEVTAGNAIVTGYDFIQDGAQAMCSRLNGDGLTTNCTLIGTSWNATQFKSNVLNTRHDVVSINGHANHYTMGTPSGSVYSSDVVGATADHARAIFYTVGCHSGLNVPPNNPTQPLDLAQALIQRKANYVANTGYGWGYVTSVGLSEQLMLDFTERLVYGSSASVGQALAAAKQEYYLNEGSFDYYDEKIMIESTLYGLPMLRYSTPSAAAGQLQAQAQNQAAAAVEKQERAAVLGNGLTVNSIAYQFPALLAESTDDGLYYTFGGLAQAGDGEPIQPKYTADLSFPQTEAHGVVFRGGAYTDVVSFNPVVDRAITETSTLAEPVFSAPGWYPALPYRLNSLERGDNLVAFLGQFNSQGQTERVYDRLSFDVYYHTSSGDWTPPAIKSMSSGVTGGSTLITVGAEDASGIQAVVIAYTDGNGFWASVSLTESGSRWSGSFPASGGTVFFIQAVDKAGNVVVNDNGGQYFRPGDDLFAVYLPLALR